MKFFKSVAEKHVLWSMKNEELAKGLCAVLFTAYYLFAGEMILMPLALFMLAITVTEVSAFATVLKTRDIPDCKITVQTDILNWDTVKVLTFSCLIASLQFLFESVIIIASLNLLAGYILSKGYYELAIKNYNRQIDEYLEECEEVM